eukprot:763895-Hanusia_phi.AAC.6
MACDTKENSRLRLPLSRNACRQQHDMKAVAVDMLSDRIDVSFVLFLSLADLHEVHDNIALQLPLVLL